MVFWFSGKKRYGCCDCKWRGWKAPLPRRAKAKPRPILHRQVTPGTSILVVAVSIVAIVLVSLQAACNPAQETMSSGPVSIVRNPLW
jgi:hypothetical protein